VVRLILLTKIGSLARGYSGVRPLIIDTLIALYNAGIMPAIPGPGLGRRFRRPGAAGAHDAGHAGRRPGALQGRAGRGL
jgi:hypothetical protein